MSSNEPHVKLDKSPEAQQLAKSVVDLLEPLFRLSVLVSLPPEIDGSLVTLSTMADTRKRFGFLDWYGVLEDKKAGEIIGWCVALEDGLKEVKEAAVKWHKVQKK